MTVLIPSYEPDQRLVTLIEQLRAMTDIPIVVVDDGSGDSFRGIFETVRSAGCIVLTHATNRGKGRALKTGFQYIREHGEEAGVVCADSDGQHAPKDILAVNQMINARETGIVLGSRKFTGNIPLRSRFGNRLTSKIYDVATGIHVQDTQTGLRGYPSQMLDWLCQVPGERFEYEMNLLLEAPAQGYVITELPIETIYLDDNRSSHFRPVIDSLKVYLPFLKYCASSVISGVLDFVLLVLLQVLTSNLLVSVIGARVASSVANYAWNRRFVFSRAKKFTLLSSMTRYYSLVMVILALNYGLLYLFHVLLGAPLVLAKLVTECLLFLLSFWYQRKFVY